jgi:hypothetical protein
MRASFLFLPRDLTEQRISGLERLLLLWEWVERGLLDLIIGIRAGQLHGSGERNREAILAEFFEGDFGDLGEAVTIENVGDGVTHIEHEKTEATVLLVGAGAFGVGRVAHASDRSERAVDETHDLAHGDVFRRLREEETTMLAALAIDDTGLSQLNENLLQKREWDFFPRGNFLKGNEISTGLAGKNHVDQRTQSVFAAFGQFHGRFETG